jgi:hypothetical protein
MFDHPELGIVPLKLLFRSAMVSSFGWSENQLGGSVPVIPIDGMYNEVKFVHSIKASSGKGVGAKTCPVMLKISILGN